MSENEANNYKKERAGGQGFDRNQPSVYLGFYVPGQRVLLRAVTDVETVSPPPVVACDVSGLFDNRKV